MFGYVMINKPEIRFKDFDIYRSYYCGLCRELKERGGIPGQLSLTYDMTFVILLLSGLYEPKTLKGTTHCAVHPLTSCEVRKNTFTEYAADMNLLLTYYKCMDDWKDERKLLQRSYARILRGKEKKLEKNYEKKVNYIVSCLDRLSQMEKDGENDLDKLAGAFGDLMGEILVCREDMWEESLRKMGFYFGKYIYILDAYDDVQKDVKKGSFNPFAGEWQEEGFDDKVRELLLMMLSSACRYYERLPVIRYREILRNILYSGVWCRFETICEKRKEKREDTKHVGSI
ncbi:MAG: hypothetical protein IIY55_01585 [Blautia sp.]|nr:hypothetical protein [Blautia sp.]